eukprot:CAMPEP_0179711054 /NCGR_PEP_ID=MMETSP0937-20121108/6783_1 /TAXON_ID=548131 ORGANISM="Ostreococcus mediterraneus, Strain clade-D-RCC2593" /NCGR_SAMPLE_ID=MMETSP0937 /ASSEMBLY_ACC=CAM_ASM_000575 /LENGTH=68 /DNA_ID=CAMNT_0021584583 /DNA_START=191 /DNA_END=394 /DNA_ORIENTATION=+
MIEKSSRARASDPLCDRNAPMISASTFFTRVFRVSIMPSTLLNDRSSGSTPLMNDTGLNSSVANTSLD